MSEGQGSSVGIVTGWTVRGSNTGGDDIFGTRTNWPLGPHNLVYNGYRVSSEDKEDWAWR